MRIGFNAHLLSFAPGYRRAGVSQYTEQLLHHFITTAAQAGDTLSVYAGGSDAARAWMAEHSTIHYHASHLPTARPQGRIFWEQAVAPVVTRRDRLDVLFCPVNVVPLVGRVPSVVTVHDLAFLAHPEAFHLSKRGYLSLLTRLSVQRAHRVIAVSAHTKADLVRHFHVAPGKVTVIPNAMDHRFRPATDPAALSQFRHDHHLPERFILFVGTLEPRKNLRRLIDAFARVARDDCEVALVIVGGSGWMTSDLAPLVQQRNLGDRITFTGYVPDDELPRWYQAATIFCYPSLYEGFGLPVLEAMACGTPVVTSNTSAIPEVAGDAAVLIDPTDVTALADSLLALLSDAPRWEELGRAGIARSRGYSWECTAAATYAVVREAAGD
ncbi:MAG: glycosyltransferase family 4 protein [Thermomicrobiales bacterium]